MHVNLSRHGEDILRKYLNRGLYHSPDEVIDRALETLAERDNLDLEGLAQRHAPAEFVEFLDRLAIYSEKVPPMPDETFSRSTIYQDHE